MVQGFTPEEEKKELQKVEQQKKEDETMKVAMQEEMRTQIASNIPVNIPIAAKRIDAPVKEEEKGIPLFGEEVEQKNSSLMEMVGDILGKQEAEQKELPQEEEGKNIAEESSIIATEEALENTIAATANAEDAGNDEGEAPEKKEEKKEEEKPKIEAKEEKPEEREKAEVSGEKDKEAIEENNNEEGEKEELKEEERKEGEQSANGEDEGKEEEKKPELSTEKEETTTEAGELTPTPSEEFVSVEEPIEEAEAVEESQETPAGEEPKEESKEETPSIEIVPTAEEKVITIENTQEGEVRIMEDTQKEEQSPAMESHSIPTEEEKTSTDTVAEGTPQLVAMADEPIEIPTEEVIGKSEEVVLPGEEGAQSAQEGIPEEETKGTEVILEENNTLGLPPEDDMSFYDEVFIGGEVQKKEEEQEEEKREEIVEQLHEEEGVPVLPVDVEEAPVEQNTPTNAEDALMESLFYLKVVGEAVDAKQGEQGEGELIPTEEEQEAYQLYVSEQRLNTTTEIPEEEERGYVYQLNRIRRLVEHEEYKQQTQGDEQKAEDFFLLQRPLPIRYIYEYFLSLYMDRPQVIFTPVVPYTLIAKNTVRSALVLRTLLYTLPVDNRSFFATIKDEVVPGYVRLTIECGATSYSLKRYDTTKMAIKEQVEALGGRFAIRGTETKLQVFVDFPIEENSIIK